MTKNKVEAFREHADHTEALRWSWLTLFPHESEISPQSLLEQKLQPKKERENNYSGLMSETNFFFPQLQLVLGTVEL